jgi:predicted DNA-binding mobile mystery protein A
MKKSFRKMMQDQLQASLTNLNDLAQKPSPKTGWIQAIRKALGLSSRQLAKRLGCAQPNVMAFERREKERTITLETLDQVARAMNCRCVYFFIPNKPFDQILKERAQLVAKKRLSHVGHSMELEQQGLSEVQKQQQEDDLAEELLQGNPKDLWSDGEI